jgi:hypothetical protein
MNGLCSVSRNAIEYSKPVHNNSIACTVLTTKQAKLDQKHWHNISHWSPYHILMVDARYQNGRKHCNLVVKLALEKL